MKFELEESLRGASNEEILAELRRVATLTKSKTVSRGDFQKLGKCAPGTIVRRFGSWNNGLQLAGLSLSLQRNITDEELYLNLRDMWMRLGRQPRYSEVRRPISKYSAFTYEKRFGSFSEALRVFVAWANSPNDQLRHFQSSVDFEERARVRQQDSVTRRSSREISDRQRFRILLRDGFRCKSCGASPLKESDVELHVDHIVPWSKGGEIVDSNLVCKCKTCNLGKGNAFEA